MAKNQERVQYAVDGDAEIVEAADRYRQLRAWIEQADTERKQIAEKLRIKMDEHRADELTVGGIVIVRLSRYTQYTVTRVRDFAAVHPRIFKTWGKTTPVERVDVP